MRQEVELPTVKLLRGLCFLLKWLARLGLTQSGNSEALLSSIHSNVLYEM